MFFIAAAMVVAAATASPAQASPPADATPLRSVVYKVSLSRGVVATVEGYGGGEHDPFDSTMTSATENGTVTVDVMVVANNTLGLRITELWTKSGRPVTYLGNIAPDGTLNFEPSSISDVTREFLPLFGPLFANGKPLDSVGIAWDLIFQGKNVDVHTRYTVKKIDGDLVTLEKEQVVNGKGISGMGFAVNGKLSYKPALLVPISGDITKRASGSSAGSNVQITLSLHFDRISDSREPSKK